jgi:biotin operon repressor
LRAPLPLVARAELLRAELALRRLEMPRARRALARAQQAAERAAIPGLAGALTRFGEALEAPAARLIRSGEVTTLRLEDVARVLGQQGQANWLVDCCQRVLRRGARGDGRVEFVRKPVLFSLLRALAEAWPNGVPRDGLIQRGFGATHVNASHRARLRVELGRLRKQLGDDADVCADTLGYRLEPPAGVRVSVLVPPFDGEDAALVALLADGAAWSSSALALALGASQRTLQRLLAALQARGVVSAAGQGRARRWCAAPLTTLGPQVYGLFSYGAGRHAP